MRVLLCGLCSHTNNNLSDILEKRSVCNFRIIIGRVPAVTQVEYVRTENPFILVYFLCSSLSWVTAIQELWSTYSFYFLNGSHTLLRQEPYNNFAHKLQLQVIILVQKVCNNHFPKCNLTNHLVNHKLQPCITSKV